jgi:hypothetical protein
MPAATLRPWSEAGQILIKTAQDTAGRPKQLAPGATHEGVDGGVAPLDIGFVRHAELEFRLF